MFNCFRMYLVSNGWKAEKEIGLQFNFYPRGCLTGPRMMMVSRDSSFAPVLIEEGTMVPDGKKLRKALTNMSKWKLHLVHSTKMQLQNFKYLELHNLKLLARLEVNVLKACLVPYIFL